MHLESHESADDRQYYDYHMDRNGHSLHDDEQDLTPTKMKTPKLPTAKKVLAEYFDAENRVDEKVICMAIESHTQSHTEGLREQLETLRANQERYAKEVSEQYGEYIDLNVSLRDENTVLRERVKELEALLKTWVKQNNYLRRHSISDFDDVHNQTKKALK